MTILVPKFSAKISQHTALNHLTWVEMNITKYLFESYKKTI